MKEFLYGYELNLTTWMYLSSLLTIAIYFKFSRLWSLRNLDLLGLIALAPGLLLVGLEKQHIGYIWLLATGVFFLVRLLMDPMMVRRPLLEPNLSPGGLAFLTVSLLVFLLVNVLTKDPQDSDLAGPRRLRDLLERKETTAEDATAVKLGPGHALLHLLPGIPIEALMPPDPHLSQERGRYDADVVIARTMAILSHLIVVIGMMLIKLRHYDNILHRNCRGDVVSALALHGRNDGARAPRAARGNSRAGHPGLSSAAAVRHVDWPGNRHNLLPDISAPVVVRILLAAGIITIPGRFCVDAGDPGRHAGIHLPRFSIVSRTRQEYVRLDQLLAR